MVPANCVIDAGVQFYLKNVKVAIEPPLEELAITCALYIKLAGCS